MGEKLQPASANAESESTMILIRIRLPFKIGMSFWVHTTSASNASDEQRFVLTQIIEFIIKRGTNDPELTTKTATIYA